MESIMDSSSTPLFEHLLAFRKLLLHSILAVLLVFIALAYFARDIYALLSQPLLAALPDQASMIATDVASPFLTPFKLTLVVSFFISIPYVLYQLWRFIAPGLYQHEKRLIAPLIVSSSLLFYAGIAFAYFVLLPIAFAFFAYMAPEGVMIATDISKYLDFVLKIFFAFGVAFEVPVAVILMCWTGVTTPEKLKEKRPYVVVGAFALGMLLTPPDVISQTLLALPLWLLFELGIFFGRFYIKKETD